MFVTYKPVVYQNYYFVINIRINILYMQFIRIPSPKPLTSFPCSTNHSPSKHKQQRKGISLSTSTEQSKKRIEIKASKFVSRTHSCSSKAPSEDIRPTEPRISLFIAQKHNKLPKHHTLLYSDSPVFFNRSAMTPQQSPKDDNTSKALLVSISDTIRLPQPIYPPAQLTSNFCDDATVRKPNPDVLAKLQHCKSQDIESVINNGEEGVHASYIQASFTKHTDFFSRFTKNIQCKQLNTMYDKETIVSKSLNNSKAERFQVQQFMEESIILRREILSNFKVLSVKHQSLQDNIYLALQRKVNVLVTIKETSSLTSQQIEDIANELLIHKQASQRVLALYQSYIDGTVYIFVKEPYQYTLIDYLKNYKDVLKISVKYLVDSLLLMLQSLTAELNTKQVWLKREFLLSDIVFVFGEWKIHSLSMFGLAQSIAPNWARLEEQISEFLGTV